MRARPGRPGRSRHRARVVLAMALTNDPAVLIADDSIASAGPSTVDRGLVVRPGLRTPMLLTATGVDALRVRAAGLPRRPGSSPAGRSRA
jgi:hypothetical protein